MGNLLEIKGHNGTLVVNEKNIVIKRGGLTAFITKGASSDKEVPIKNISAIEFIKPGLLTNGKFQISVPGENAFLNKRQAGGFDENTIIFKKSQTDDFLKAKNLINELREKAETVSHTVVNQLSSADELKKYAELKEQGIISEDDFNAKKKELLGL